MRAGWGNWTLVKTASWGGCSAYVGVSLSGWPDAVEQASSALCLLGELALFNFLSGYEVGSKIVRENRERRGEKKQTRFRGNPSPDKDRAHGLGPGSTLITVTLTSLLPSKPVCVCATIPGIAHIAIDPLTSLQGTQTAFLT